jgi:penicillin-binding protein 2
MNAINGAVIVMNVRTGEILSLVSAPSFDANKFVEGITPEYWNALNANSAKPMNNKAVSSTYPPGSTFKLMTALAGLENGWSDRKEITCDGELKLNRKRTLHCWRRNGHGRIDLIEAIKHSCNIYFAEVGMFAGIENIHKIATSFGFGEKFDLHLTNVKNGIIPNKEWKRKVLNDVWVVGDTVNIAIGQGFLTATPLELVVMVSRIANGGYPVKPVITLNNPLLDYNANLFEKEPMVSEKSIKTVQTGMYKVVNERGGTTFPYRIRVPGFEMAGKTGTAQVISKDAMTALEESGDDTSKFKHHGLFIAFAPFNDPMYGIVVVSEHGVSGSDSAAPLARDILTFAQEHMIIAPQTEEEREERRKMKKEENKRKVNENMRKYNEEIEGKEIDLDREE